MLAVVPAGALTVPDCCLHALISLDLLQHKISGKRHLSRASELVCSVINCLAKCFASIGGFLRSFASRFPNQSACILPTPRMKA